MLLLLGERFASGNFNSEEEKRGKDGGGMRAGGAGGGWERVRFLYCNSAIKLFAAGNGEESNCFRKSQT